MAGHFHMAARPGVMNAIAGPRPASGRRVAIRRPGLHRGARCPEQFAQLARGVVHVLDPEGEAPEAGGPAGSRATLVPSGACTTSRIGSPARKNACRVEPPGVSPSRLRRRSKPCDSSSATVLSRSGASITT